MISRPSAGMASTVTVKVYSICAFSAELAVMVATPSLNASNAPSAETDITVGDDEVKVNDLFVASSGFASQLNLPSSLIFKVMLSVKVWLLLSTVYSTGTISFTAIFCASVLWMDDKILFSWFPTLVLMLEDSLPGVSP